jgi:pimeloyl-ACP methyl ester carboxylesterase
VLLVLADDSQLPVAELPGEGPWTFLVLQPAPDLPGPRFLTRFGRVVVPDLRERPGWAATPEEPGFLDLVDDLDQIRTRAGLGRPVLVGLDQLAPLARRAAADQPWAWRALLLTPPADLGRLDLPALVLGADPAPAVEELLGRLGPGPGWAGIAPDAPPR